MHQRLVPSPMNASNRQHTMLVVLCFSMGLIPTLGMAQSFTAEEEEEIGNRISEDLTDTVYELGTQAAPDPWAVGSSAAILSRPSVGQVLKLSGEIADGEHTYSLSAAPTKILKYSNRFTDGLQPTLGYSAESQQASFGIKWNLSFRDLRFFPKVERDHIYKTNHDDFKKCNDELKQRKTTLSRNEFDQENEKCRKPYVAAVEKAYKAALLQQKLRPSFSIGTSVTYGFDRDRWGKFASNVSMELPISDFSVIVNGDFISSRVEYGERRQNLGGSLGLNYVLNIKTAPDALNKRLSFTLAGNIRDCIKNCGEESSTVRFGPALNYTFGSARNSVLGLALNWRTSGQSADDVFLGLSLSHSLGIASFKNE